MREQLAAEPGADLALAIDIGRSLTAIGHVLDRLGRNDQALAAFRRSEALLQGLAASHPSARAALAECRARWAAILRYEDKHAEALAVCCLARADQEVLAAVPGASRNSRRALAETIDTTGYMLSHLGRWEEAVAELRTALAIYQKLADESPDDVNVRQRAGAAHFYLGYALPLVGKPSEAEKEFRKALELYQALVDRNPTVTIFRRYMGLVGSYYSVPLLEMGRLAEAEAQCRKAFGFLETVVLDDSTVVDYRSVLAENRYLLGIVLLQAGKKVEAETECRKGRDLLGALATDSYHKREFANALDALGDVVRASGRASEAYECYAQAVSLREPLWKNDPLHRVYRYDLARSLWRRGLALLNQGDLAAATAQARRALTVSDGLISRSGTHSFETACCHAVLAALAGRSGSGVRAAEGEQAANRAMEWLHRAVAQGYRNTNELRIESALDPLRNRPDFKKLMAALEKNSQAQQDKKRIRETPTDAASS